MCANHANITHRIPICVSLARAKSKNLCGIKTQNVRKANGALIMGKLTQKKQFFLFRFCRAMYQWFYCWYRSFRLIRQYGTKFCANLEKERLAICENCPTSHFNKRTRQCRSCHCFMDIKAGLPAFGCAEGHYPAIDEPKDYNEK